MKHRITILPDDLVHKIAAGEVVERPASVVKELVENSLDAEASQISISLNNGGKRLIRVSDDGWGMSQQDALLALERHATSKIQDSADLSRIGSLGFRGEALPSIAAVSRMKLITKTQEALAASQIVLEGGKIKRVTEVGSPTGTIVEVSSLFFNVPARYKFLKSSSTELGHITQYISQIALAHLGVRLSLYHQGRPMIEAAATDLKERIAEIYSPGLAEQLLAVEHELGKLRISGYVSKPQFSRSGRYHQSTFVNRRLVKDRLIYRAVHEAYQRLLAPGRQPLWVLFLELEPELVDVNVHPAKTEVRFLQPQQIRQLVVEGVSRALSGASAAPRLVTRPSSRPEVSHGPTATSHHQQQIKQALTDYLATRRPAELPSLKPVASHVPKAKAGLHPPAAPATNAQFFASLLPIGQLSQTFILCQSQQELVIIDQHAAHEKVIYEELQNKLDSGSVPSQRLLFPRPLELSPQERGIIEEHRGMIEEVGFEVTGFGGNTYILTAAPVHLEAEAAPRAILDIIAELMGGRKPDPHGLKRQLLAKIACHSAVKAHQPLQSEEIASLLDQLARLEAPFNCPHGRPTLVRYSLSELNKQFRRSG
jgi:DNA mismatch repair protein MutL